MIAGSNLDDIEHWDMVVVYDPADGRIIHTHQMVTWRGGKHPSRQDREREALEQAALERKSPLGKTAALHLDPRKLKLTLDTHYRVEPNKRVLVEIPRLKKKTPS